MRVVEKAPLQFDKVNISDIYFDPQSRDDIPQILKSLQHLYLNEALRKEVFKVLESLIPKEVSAEKGRPGMELWKILVLSMLRVNLNCDYDRIQELANQHITLRQILGHTLSDMSKQYKLQTLKDNLSLMTEDALLKINKIVIDEGHQLLKKKSNDDLKGRCDSFVLKTPVHFPTDMSLLYDAVRCALRDTSHLCDDYNVTYWRQWKYQVKQVKKSYRKIQKLKKSNSKDLKKQEMRKKIIQEAYQNYIESANVLLIRVKNTLLQLREERGCGVAEQEQIAKWLKHGDRQVQQIRQRVIEGKKIPHAEKVFSIFEEHTEWINKGKAGISVELGLRICILESSSGFILHHKVMEKITDEGVAIDMIKDTQAHFPALRSCSFDKGFHSPYNQQALAELLDMVVLPKKGRWSQADKERETTEEFVSMRQQHSAVESGINALEIHGLDVCPDKGLKQFKKYVALAVVGRNLQKLGAILCEKERKKLRRKPRRIRSFLADVA